MSHTLLGLALALLAALIYGSAVSLQARQVRRVPGQLSLQLSLLGRLLHQPLWVVGGLAGIGGWAVQAAALSLAPLTVVEPALASSLVFILAISALEAREALARREVVAVLSVAIGVAGLGRSAPAHHAAHAQGFIAIAILMVLGLVTIAPQVVRRPRPMPTLLGLSAGVAYGLVALTTRFAVDDLSVSAWAETLGWIGLVIAVGTFGLLNEMSAFQAQNVRRVAPIVFGLHVVTATVAAPTLAHEHWGGSLTAQLTLALSLVLVLAGVATLSRSMRVAGALAGQPA